MAKGMKEEPKPEPKIEPKPAVKPDFKNAGEHWRSLTAPEKKIYLELYSNLNVRKLYPDVVELAWSEYVKRPKEN